LLLRIELSKKTCPEKKLEEIHCKILAKIVAYCLPKEKITLECPTNHQLATLRQKAGAARMIKNY